MLYLNKIALLLLAFAALSSCAAAAVIPSSAITASASSVFFPSLTDASFTIDESGLTGDQHDNQFQGNGMWLSQEFGGGSAANNPAGLAGPAWLLYSFSQPHTFDELWVWNHNQQSLTNRGLRNVSIHISYNGSDWTKWGDVELAQAPGTAGYAPGNIINLGQMSGKYVLITCAAVDGNYGSTYYGLSEVRFYGEPAPCVPPDYPVQITSPAAPATSLTLMLGLETNGWIGSDVVHSIEVSTTQSVWLFGDTLIGQIQNGARQPGFAFINNSIAIQDRRIPAPGGLTYHWGPGNTSFFPHQPGTPGNLYWPTNGVCINGELFLFCYSVISGLNLANTTLIRVTNPLAHPDEWNWTAVDFGINNAAMGFHTALFVDEPWLYMMGYDSSGDMVLARMSTSALLGGATMLAMQFWQQGPGGPAWGGSPSNLEPLFTPSMSESNIQFVPEWGRYFVTTLSAISPTIHITTAESLTGPWSDPVCIYEVPEHELVSFDIWSYAARPHPELSTFPGELFISYATNAVGTLAPLLTEEGLQIYAPRMIRLVVEPNAIASVNAWSLF